MLRLSIRLLKLLLLAAVLAYCSVLFAMWYKQRDFLFNFQHRGVAFETLDLTNTEVKWLHTPDGVKLEAFYHPPRQGEPITLFFHGKGTSLAREAPTLRTLAEQGMGFLAVSYRGAGNSTGESTETGLVTDAVTAYDWLVTQGYDKDRIMALGLSLGTGVAVQLATQRPVAGLALGAPYTSTVEVAAERYWYLPVYQLMKDQFLSETFIKKVKAPLLVLHGTDDRTIPFRFGERLFAAANEPKQIIRVEGSGHPVIFRTQSIVEYANFFKAVYARTLAAR